MSREAVPAGVPPILSVKAAAAALGIDQRQMLGWVVRGYVRGAFQVTKRGKYWVPAEMLQEFTQTSFYKEPDWEAAIEVDG